jgi:hypothetical protein
MSRPGPRIAWRPSYDCLVTRFGERAVWFEFTSDRFDHASELPPEANAGNRFYGRDVAEFISTGLAERGFDASYIDEDWGWQAHGRRPDGSVLEVSVYHNADDEPDTENGWAIMMRSLHKERLLGIVPRFRESEVDDAAIATLEDVFRQFGIELRRTPAR